MRHSIVADRSPQASVLTELGCHSIAADRSPQTSALTEPSCATPSLLIDAGIRTDRAVVRPASRSRRCRHRVESRRAVRVRATPSMLKITSDRHAHLPNIASRHHRSRQAALSERRAPLHRGCSTSARVRHAHPLPDSFSTRIRQSPSSHSFSARGRHAHTFRALPDSFSTARALSDIDDVARVRLPGRARQRTSTS